ncbi:MAG: hypothetical protein LKM32_03785 [Chiayiivirga sp.]|jgi:hypothetical protein|uniref:hypothetical protein n=1 Tax=Chiayiivirga sp. TaxID=2041042 RepID=UPI0025BBCE82|nr:hypothetical protein [Chiayiivirga sp.]MCI1710626.1 hypothetical protein [Chiayiivirga sp.]MCI1728536.1 hypothetical protein [Chiayiivirga sp.]
MRSKLGRAIALGLGLALLVPSAQADWKTDYDKGLKAKDAGQWVEAQRLFASAAREEPEPAERKRFQGVVQKLYVPHYYAGLAAYRQNDCKTALEYWNHTATNAVIAGKPEKGVQASGIADCNQKLAAVSKPTTTTPTTTTPTPGPATTAPVTTTTPNKPVAVVPPPTPTPIKPTPPPVAMPSSTPAPAALVSAVEAWVGGRYDAVAQLNPAALADGRSKAQAFLLRAAARHTQAEIADDERVRESARQDIRAARQANAALSPDEILFSPRFRAFWRATR